MFSMSISRHKLAMLKQKLYLGVAGMNSSRNQSVSTSKTVHAVHFLHSTLEHYYEN